MEALKGKPEYLPFLCELLIIRSPYLFVKVYSG
jgi:hypothetical protein